MPRLAATLFGLPSALRLGAALVGTAALVSAALLLGGCGGDTPSGAAPSAYAQAVLQHRLAKDMRMRDPKRSVLTASTRARFQGLRYFAVDPDLRFVVPLLPAAAAETVWVEQRLGGRAPYRRAGYVEIPFPDGVQRLAVFHTGPDAEAYWLPFADGTTGRETYGAGRYLDLPRTDGGQVVVDFNMAYNPLCNYNPDDYNCALPPAQNRLPFRVEAGEKKSLLHGS
jgi:hypothetical protein